MSTEYQFIAPYSDGEMIKAAIGRLLGHPNLPIIAQRYFPDVHRGDFVKMASSIQTADEFQQKVIAPAVLSMLDQSSDGFSYSGVDSLDSNDRYLFISNHRDIIVDSALVCMAMHEQNMPTPEICLGDNLLSNEWIVDLVKVNKGITVKRDLSQRELLKWSKVLSAYIGEVITNKKSSVWLAQKEGRTKDGWDQTHPGIVKMLGLGHKSDLLEHLGKLNIRPVSISYEYEPCGFKKAQENYLRRTEGDYLKSDSEDLDSMAMGITQPKGRIHLSIGGSMNEVIENAKSLPVKADQVKSIVDALDSEIRKGYKIWPNQWIAKDLIEKSNVNCEKRYSEKEKQQFVSHLAKCDLRFQEDYLRIVSRPLGYLPSSN